jgi:Terminase small subunit
MNDKPLSHKHARFVEEYLKDNDARAAAVRAGYKARSAAVLLANVAIRNAIQSRQEAAISELIKRADEAYTAAERAGNVAGMVQATKLKAELTGVCEETFYEATFREEPVIEAAMIECDAAAVVVEGPGHDAKFLSEWVAAAVKLQAAWDLAGKGPDGELYNDVLYGELIHFGLWSIDFISRLRRSQRAVAAVLPFAEYEETHYFALMMGLGFFEAAADHYRMVVPNDFQPATLKTSAMAYLGASLTDSEGTKFLFPHRIITTMSIAEAEALQKRLIAIDKFNEENRCDIALATASGLGRSN